MAFNQKINNMIQDKGIRTVIITATLLLIVPLVASQFVDGFNWTILDFIFAWVFFIIAGLTYVLLSRLKNSTGYKTLVGIGVGLFFLAIWVLLATG